MLDVRVDVAAGAARGPKCTCTCTCLRSQTRSRVRCSAHGLLWPRGVQQASRALWSRP